MKMKREKTTDAIKILQNRYIKNDIDREVSLEAERINAKIARMIYELRQDKELSQTELAKLIGTTQSVISRLEDADYEGHSLSMLQRIAKAFDCEISISLVKEDSRYVDKPAEVNPELIIKHLEEMNRRLDKIETNVGKPNIILLTGSSSATNVDRITTTVVRGQAVDTDYKELLLDS